MTRLLYLLLGILLKQTVDVVKELTGDYVAYLRRHREKIAQIQSDPTVQTGAPAAGRTSALNEQTAFVESEIRRLTLKIIYVRCIPLVVYLLLTGVLLGSIWRLDTTR